jgi:hypothetical protein
MTTKIIFDITLTIIIIYIFFIYNVEHNSDLPDKDTSIIYETEEINNVRSKYTDDIKQIKYLYDIAKKIQIENEYLTVSQKQLIIGSGATGATGATGDIKFTDCFASGYISVGSAKIDQHGDIYGNNLNLKGSISNIGDIITGSIIVEANNDKGDLIELINTQKKDDKWIISNTKSKNINDNKLSFTKIIGNTKDISVLELYDNGDVNIPGNLKVTDLYVNNIYQKRNKAKYIRVGNMITTDLSSINGQTKSELAVPNNWSLSKIIVYDHKGNNVAQSANEVSKISSEPFIFTGYDNKPSNIVNSELLYNNVPGTSTMIGYYGGVGYHLLEIELKEEYDIYRIELYNMYNPRDREKTSRMNGTMVELINYDHSFVNRRIHTGLWTSVLSKEYIL